MRYRSNPFAITALALAVLTLPSLLRAQATKPAIREADLYTEAFESIKEDKTNLLDDPDQTALNARTGKYLDDNKATIALLKKAAAVPTPPNPDGPQDMQAILDRLNPHRHSVNLLRLDARYALSQKRPADSVDDLLAAMAVARHAGSLKILVGRLVECGAEIASIQTLAQVLPSLPPDLLKTLPQRLSALHPPTTFADTIHAEYDYGHDQAKAAGADMLPIFEAAKPFYDALAAAGDQSPTDFAATVKREQGKILLNPYAKMIAPALSRVREPLATLEVQRSMLAVAIASLGGDAGALKNSHDPFSPDGKSPFTYTKTGAGFTLTSQFTNHDKPVTLKVGR